MRMDVSSEGSSPLTRGKRGVAIFGNSKIGLIPTHAGKTEPDHLVFCVAQAHPHSRGENAQKLQQFKDDTGSSPLTRGKQAYARRRPPPLGLIPTHAGKTTTTAFSASATWAHPHSRGENAAVTTW